jgi:membrane-bound metal-dependent hydrolase YbcI (DUF457 family)
MYAVGHIALGHLAAKITNRATKQNLNIPAIWILSLLPDLDFLIPGVEHRGPTHSLIPFLLAFTPLIIKKEKTAPYMAAALTHSLIGDLPTGGVQLLWPLSTNWIQYPIKIRMNTPLESNIELLLFFILITIMIISKDYKHLVNSNNRNAVLLISLSAILLLLITYRYPLPIPKVLIMPHVIILSIAGISILNTLKNQIIK